MGGMQGIGMMGTLGSSSAMRPPGVPVRPVQSSPRPQSSPSIQSPATQVCASISRAKFSLFHRGGWFDTCDLLSGFLVML